MRIWRVIFLQSLLITLTIINVLCLKPISSRTISFDATCSQLKLKKTLVCLELYTSQSSSVPQLSKSQLEDEFVIEEVSDEELKRVSKLCVDIFFSASGKVDLWKSAQYQQLYDEQLEDLTSRLSKNECNMFKAVNSRQPESIVGFIEISMQKGMKYGMGDNIPESDSRPTVTNLAVMQNVRRFGIGSRLLKACEEQAIKWGHDEIVLQVEKDNAIGRAFYERKGFDILFEDRASRRYDTSGIFLKSVRCTKLTLRKKLRKSPQLVDATQPINVSWNIPDFMRNFLRMTKIST